MSGTPILVTGATGTIGGEVVRQLAAGGHRVRALVRSKAKAVFDPAVEVVKADLSRPDTLSAAFAGAGKALVVVNGLDLETLEANAFEAAKAAGLRHVVKISGRHVDAEFLEGSILAKWRHRSESRLRALGTRSTILRPGTFMSNVPLWVDKAAGAVFLPVGDGADVLVDPRDIAEVAVRVLTTEGHDGALYELTGPAYVRYADAVRELGEAIGRPLNFVDVTAEAARAGMLQAGLPASQADAVLMLLGAIKAGKAYPPTAAVRELLGRPARSYGDWLADHAADLRERLAIQAQ